METNFLVLSTPIFFILIALELLVARWQGKNYYRFNDAITDLSCGIGQQVISLFIKVGLYTGYVYAHQYYALFKLSANSLLTWIIAFFAVDFAYYWWHRLSHEVNFLWAVHVVHHQSEDYNLAVALRQAWFSSITIWGFYLPITLIGVPPQVLLTMSIFSTLYQFWIHTRLIGRLGPIEWILNTPSHHRVHHARNPQYLDKNYGATLIVWDILFGSFQQEKEEVFYGLVKHYKSWNPIWANFYYWVELAKDALQAPYLIDKLKIWFMYPGWYPRSVQKQPSPEESTQPIRFHTRIPQGLKLYIMVQFWLIVATIVLLMSTGDKLQLWEELVLAIVILCTMFIWGGLFERKTWAVTAELARLVMLPLLVVGYLSLGEGMFPTIITIFITFAIFFIWLLRYRTESLPPSYVGGK